MGYCLSWPGFRDPPAVVRRGISKRSARQLLQLLQLFDARAPRRWIWGGRCAPIFSASWRRIHGSLVHLVVDCRVSGHEIDGKDSICAGFGSRVGRFKQWGGVRGSQVSLNEKSRSKAALIVGAVVLVVTYHDPFVRNIRYAFRSARGPELRSVDARNKDLTQVMPL